MKTTRMPAKKRSSGEGSYRKLDAEKWEGRVSINYKRHSVYGKTRAECAKKIFELKERLEVGVEVKLTPMLAEWIEIWLNSYVAVDRKSSTLENYKTIASRHILPNIGRIRLEKLKPHDIQRLIAKKMKEGLSARTVRLIHHVVRCSLNVAIRNKLIATNPAIGASLPQIEDTEMATISASDLNQLQSANLVEEEPLFPCILLMAFTGLRRGEALALRWSDIDLENCSLSVMREIVKTPGGTKFQKPKTKYSNRLIPINTGLQNLLLDHKNRQDILKKELKATYKDQDLVFARETGSPYYPDSLRKVLHRILKKVGIGPIRVHDLRHTCATLLMLSGAPAKVVQEILGHSNISITLGTYSHTIPSLKQGAIDILNKFVTASIKAIIKPIGNFSYPKENPKDLSEPCLKSNLEDPVEKPELH